MAVSDLVVIHDLSRKFGDVMILVETSGAILRSRLLQWASITVASASENLTDLISAYQFVFGAP